MSPPRTAGARPSRGHPGRLRPAPAVQPLDRAPGAVGESELVIRALYEITSDYRCSFESQIERLLDLGCRRFDMELGVLSRIEGDRYTIEHHASAPRFGIEAGMAFELESTLCGLTVRAGGAVGMEDLRQSGAAEHPAVTGGGIAAYIGAPVMVEDKVWGTIAFLSQEPRPRRFCMPDVDSLQLMASWVSTELQRRLAEEALREAKARLEAVSRTDPLTGLINRRALEATLATWQEDAREVVAVLVDADDFKSVNTRFGHAGGDLVLQAIAERTAEQVRGADPVGRIGGDEFLVLLSGVSVEEAAEVAERIRASISGTPSRPQAAPAKPRSAWVWCPWMRRPAR